MTLPEGPGQRHERLFELARRLKGLPHRSDAPAESLESVARAWWRVALNAIRTKEWEETWSDFRNAWETVRFPIGTGAVSEVIRLATADPGPLPAGLARRPGADLELPVRKLHAACRALQTAAEMRGADTFFLSWRTAAFECGFKGENGYRTAGRWLERFVRANLLELVVRGIGGTKARLASEYRLNGTGSPYQCHTTALAAAA